MKLTLIDKLLIMLLILYDYSLHLLRTLFLRCLHMTINNVSV